MFPNLRTISPFVRMENEFHYRLFNPVESPKRQVVQEIMRKNGCKAVTLFILYFCLFPNLFTHSIVTICLALLRTRVKADDFDIVPTNISQSSGKTELV